MDQYRNIEGFLKNFYGTKIKRTMFILPLFVEFGDISIIYIVHDNKRSRIFLSEILKMLQQEAKGFSFAHQSNILFGV